MRTLEDVTWYSRLAVWAGALVMLAQAVTGQAPSVITLVAVLSVVAGFVTLLLSLAVPVSSRTEPPASEHASVSDAAVESSAASVEQDAGETL